MKAILVILSALALTATSVDAAPAKATAATKTKSARAANAKKVRAKRANIAAVKANPSASSASDAKMRQTVKLSETVAEAKAPKKWSLSAFNETYGASMESYSNGQLGKTQDLTADNGIRVGYKVSDDVTASVAYEWGQTLGIGDKESNTDMYDPSIRLAKSNLAQFGDVKVSGQGRLYIPASEASQDKEQIAHVRLYATASRDISKKLSASLTMNPRFYFQQDDTYIDDKGKLANQDRFRVWTFAGLKYSFNDMFAVEQTFGVYNKWRSNEARKDFLDASTSVYIAPISWLEFNLGVRQIDGATNARETGLRGLYSSDQAEYFLITSLSI